LRSEDFAIGITVIALNSLHIILIFWD